MTAALLASLAAGLAVALWWPGQWASGRRGFAGLPLLVAAAVGVGLVVPERLLAPVVVVAAAGTGGLLLLRQRRRRREVEVTQARASGFCDELVAGLGAGLPPPVALAAAADGWSALAPVLASHGLGGSVPAALRVVAARPGATDLRLVAAAWDVAHRCGGSLAPALASVAQEVRAHQRTRRVVASELASARATARLMAGLPAFTLLLGSGTGGSPVGFLLGTTPGLACLAGGLALALAGLLWIERIADSVAREAR